MVDLGFEINCAGGAKAELRANDVGPSELNDAEWVVGSLRKVRAHEANGFVVYTRKKKFTGSGGMERAKLAAWGSRKMCKEIWIAGRPTTPGELLLTGLLEGYSVFYNGGEGELPEGKWFCSANCQLLYSTLQKLLNAGAEKLPDSSLDILKNKLPGITRLLMLVLM
ncbi:hypothetical protein Salat_1011400 [Sesamum alatum]|uniref:Uncharacterized protein n=1 Tax=Sesamum alatum TaxID=300844 RepID=A0AAE1YMU0_9LAMI|nr:hypothetical protein Salat_1011400 [Sesamum alatum]